MLIKGKIENEQYKRLIKYAFQKSDAIMFVFRKDGFNDQQISKLEKTSNDLKTEFKDYILKIRNGAYWVFTKVGYSKLGIYNSKFKDQPNFDKLFEVLFYKTNKELEEYVLSNSNLYSWLNPYYPEDISFFKNGYCWLYSIAHEELCDIYCENEEEYNYLKSIGIEFIDNKFIETSNNNLYFENYNIENKNSDIQI